jgi:hypothetical protein
VATSFIQTDRGLRRYSPEDVAMEPRYRDAIDNASTDLSQALLEDIPALLEQGLRIDAVVREVLRAVGLALLSILYQALCAYLVEQITDRGLTVQSRPVVRFKTLFGEVEVESPYLRSSQSGESARPMKDILGVEGEQYSESVQRALVDFGIEKSYARAALSFQEHYGWEIGRTTLRNRTLQAAQDAETYVDERLLEAIKTSAQDLVSPAAQTMLLELDGCEIRTGIYMSAVQAGLEARPARQQVRVENWRDVRTGFARPLADQEQRLYVCRMDSYAEVCEQLVGVACAQGLSPRSQVVAPGDGAKGLCEAVLAAFPKAQYILDHPHLKSHLYDTATALELEGPARHAWVSGYLDQFWAGEVEQVLATWRQRHEDEPNERLRQLIDHVTRFEDCVDYGAYHERGWPLGSGEVESAHRYVPQERLKIAGACWNPNNVNPMLALRVVRANGWWDEFWQWRVDRKHAQMGR